MQNRNRFLLILVSAAVLAIGLAACGGDDDSDSTEASSAAATNASANGAADTVTVKSIDGNDVLVDAQGNALYANDMDSASAIACTGECAAIWIPLAAPSTGQPASGDSSVKGELSTVDRPDGTSQVTFDGMPLYTFTEDSPGQVTGDGVADSFGGTDFVWTVASTGGATADTGADTSTSSGGGSSSGSGGYGY